MPQFDTIARGGTIVDGTRVPRYRADIGIKNGKIAKIGHRQLWVWLCPLAAARCRSGYVGVVPY